MISKTQFQAATGLSSALTDKWYDPVEQAMVQSAIVSPQRAAMFLAQVGHESAGFRYTGEIWGPTPAQRRYGQRADLGNTEPQAVAIASAHGSEPGRWWKGHGLIQVTGFYNHRKCGDALQVDLLNAPHLLESDTFLAVRSATWYWDLHNLNQVSDTGDIERVTRIINGGLNGLDDRRKRYNLALAQLS